MRHYCVVPGCDADGRHALTLRIRRPDTSAIAAPNTNAWLCDEHAESGLEIDISVKPNTRGTIETFTWAERLGVAGHVEKSVTRLKVRADERGDETGEARNDRAGRMARPGI